VSRPDDGLRAIFRTHLPEFFWTSIETGGTGQGIPDSHWQHDGGLSGWVEFKRTNGWAVELDQFQQSWIERSVRLGCCVWIGVRRRNQGGPRRGPPADELHMLPGNLAREARANGLRSPVVRAHATVHQGGPARWDWPDVARCLLAAPAVAASVPLSRAEEPAHASAGPVWPKPARRPARGP
jgi:hypothetical protein